MYLKVLKMKAAISSLLILASCSTTTTGTSNISISPPEAEPIITKPVEFTVINQSTIDSLDIKNTSWYAVNPKGYENLAYNMQEILRYVKQQNAIIEYYESTTDSKNLD